MFMFLVSHPSYTSIGPSPRQDLPGIKVIFLQFLLTRWGETWTVDKLTCPWIVSSIWVLSSANSASCSSIVALACSRSISGSEWWTDNLSPHLAMLAYLSSPPRLSGLCPPFTNPSGVYSRGVWLWNHVKYQRSTSPQSRWATILWKPESKHLARTFKNFGDPKSYVREKLLHKFPHLLIWGYRLASTEWSHNFERHIKLDALKPHKIRNRRKEMYITSFERSGDQWYTCLLSVYLSS